MRYYLIGFDENGLTQLGSNWERSTWLKSQNSHKKQSAIMANQNKSIKEIYIFPENKYTQTVSEMNVLTFGEYVKEHSLYKFTY